MVGGRVKIAVCLLAGGLWLLAGGGSAAAQETEKRQTPPPSGGADGDERANDDDDVPPPGEKAGPPPDPALEAALAALDEKQASLEDLEADFEQKQVSHLLLEPDVSRGRVLFRKGRLRMEWSEPRRVVLVVDDEGFLQYFPEEKRAERTPARTQSDIGSLFPGFGQSSEEMKKTYDIRLKADETDDDQWCLELDPRRPRMRRLMKRITIWIDRKAGVPKKMRIDDPNGKDHMETTFSGTKVNQEIPESRLRLELPEDTKVITVKGGLPF